MSLAKYLKRFRKEFGLTQADVAKKSGIARQAYSRYEMSEDSGSANMPGINALIKISQAFNVSIDYLAGISNNPEINCAPRQSDPAAKVAMNTDGNEFEMQLAASINSIEKRLSKLESRFNF